MDAEALTKLGNDFQRQGNFTRAEQCYESAIHVDPDYLPALANLATVLSLQNKLLPAEDALLLVVSKAPNDPDQWLALGNVLMRQGKLDKAQTCLDQAYTLRPENPDVHINLAALAHRRQDYAKAEELLNHVLSLGQTHHLVYFDLAHIKLSQGDLVEGLKLYEHRWHTMEHSPAWDHHIPEWRGEDLTDKHLLVHAEQGFGDIIMLSRFIYWLNAKNVTFAVPSSMVSLFDFQVPAKVIDINSLIEQPDVSYDFHTPMFSMMRWLGITRRDIDPRPYLDSPDSGPTIPKFGKFNVGICWASGNQGNRQANWRRRVTDLEAWLPLADVPGVQLWSLQRDTGTEDIARLGVRGFVADPMPEVTSWADTAKLVSGLDLVISVDTGVVHLAGALGKPCWMLSQPSPCWRWWNIEHGSGLPWYSSVKIFWRRSENWPALIADCLVSLWELTSTKGI